MLYSWVILHLWLISICQIATAATADAEHGALNRLAPRVGIPAPIVVAASQDWYALNSPETEEIANLLQ